MESLVGPLLFAISYIISSKRLSRNQRRSGGGGGKGEDGVGGGLISSSSSSNVKISEIWIYPIKGCRGFKVDSWPIYRRGFAFDRLFMVVDEKFKFVSQRGIPLMTKILTSIDTKFESMCLSSEGHEDLHVNLTPPPSSTGEEATIDVTVWGTSCKAIEVQAGSVWVAKVLNNPSLKLVRMSEDFTRECEEAFGPKGETAFADSQPLMLLSKEGIDLLNSKLASKLAKPVSVENFRPNIVVAGVSIPFEEDTWQEIEIVSKSSANNNNNSNESSCSNKNTLRMECVLPCTRCKVPNNDPDTGIFYPDNEPSTTLKTFRTGESIGLKGEKMKKQICVGQHMVHRFATGVVAVDDLVVVQSINNWRS